MFVKPSLCPRYKKEIKSKSGLTRHLNACKKKVTQTTLQKIYHEFQDKKDIPDWNLEDRSQLVVKTNYIKKDATTNILNEKIL